MMDERAVFDPDEIRVLCQANLAVGLRVIADALDAGELAGTLYGVTGNGFVSWQDTKAHVILKIDLAAEVFRWQAGERLPLPPRRRFAATKIETIDHP